MSQIEDYNAQLSYMQALQASEVKYPGLPVDIAVQEAENLYATAVKYQEKLIQVGLPVEMINTLLVRAGALRESQSRWEVNHNAQQDAIKQWDEQSPVAYDLQRTLNQSFRYAYRKEERLMGRVRKIAKGNGNQDMIQDLNDYATLGKEHPEPLQKINFDLTLLDQAAEQANTLGELLAQANGDKNAQHQLRDLRDRAFTILKETVDEIRDCGKFVFANEPDIRKLFASEYNRKRNTKNEVVQDQIAD